MFDMEKLRTLNKGWRHLFCLLWDFCHNLALNKGWFLQPKERKRRCLWKNSCISYVSYHAFTVLAPAQNVEAAGKSLKVSEKAFFKEMKEFDYKGMNRYVKDWGEGGQFVSAFYMVPSGKKYFAKCASKMSYRIISTKKKGNKADVKVKFRYVNCEDFTF